MAISTDFVVFRQQQYAPSPTFGEYFPYHVGAGQTQVVHANLFPGGPSYFEVYGGGAVLASASIACGPDPAFGRVTAGKIDCSAQTIPVTIDNTALPALRSDFFISDHSVQDADLFVPGPHERIVSVAAGSKKTFQVPLAFLPSGVLYVSEFYDLFDLDHYETVLHHKVGNSCSPGAVVSAAELAQTGGISRSIPLVALGLLCVGVFLIASTRITVVRSPAPHEDPAP